MPQMGESIAEGTLSRWMKKVGDPIKRDEPIFEISTDKVDAEIPAPSRRRAGRDPGAGRPDRGGADRGRPDRDRRERRGREAQGCRHRPVAQAPTHAGARPATPAGAPPAPLAPAPSAPAQECIPPQRARSVAERHLLAVTASGRAREPVGERCHRRKRRVRVDRGAAPAQIHPAGPEDGRGAQGGHQRHSRAPGSRAG